MYQLSCEVYQYDTRQNPELLQPTAMRTKKSRKFKNHIRTNKCIKGDV